MNISAKQKIVEKKKRETKSVKKLEALKDLLGGVFGLHSLGESESLFFSYLDGKHINNII